MDENELYEEIVDLIQSRREDDYWDFKREHHSNKAELIHDVICMANNRADRDAYIIFGVEDKSYNIVGVENDVNRRNQQQIIEVLKYVKFAGGIRPRVELRTLNLNKHKIDVLIVKNSYDTPYYITSDYSESKADKSRTVRANFIYTRVGDNNTDIDKSSDINHVEYLWKKRFLLNRQPLEQIIKRLKNKEEWKQEDYTYFNIYNPEFTIIIEEEDDERLIPEFYSYALTNPSTVFHHININYFGTRLYRTQVVVLDGGRYSTTVPSWEFLYFGKYRTNADYAFKYLTKDDAAYKLNEFLYNEDNGEERYARQRFFEVVLVFNDNQEKQEFIEYVYSHKNDFIEKLNTQENVYHWIESSTKRHDEQIVIRLKTGKILNKMLDEFRGQ